jgi:predicted nucleic acid-binding protein
MIVVDTNIICYFYIHGDHSNKVQTLWKKDPNWHLPILWRSEFRNVLAKYYRNQLLSLPKIFEIIQETELLIRGNEYHIPATHVFHLIKSSSLSAYDCEFVSLAQSLNVPLITFDKKIHSEFPKTAMTIHDFLNKK